MAGMKQASVSFLIFYLYGLINSGESQRLLNWDHQNMDPVPGLPHDTNVPAGEPVKFYQIGHAGRTEYMYAQIEKKHLGTGTKTIPASTTYVRNLGGDRGDDAGHVLAKQLGGSGTENRNLFPQNPKCNGGAWYHFVESVVAKEVREHGKTDYRVKLLYRTPTDTRPYEVMGQIKLHQGSNNYYTVEIANPPNPQNCGD